MQNNVNMQNNRMPMWPMNPGWQQQNIDHLFPDIYRDMEPFVSHVMDEFLRFAGGADMTEEDMSRMIDEVIRMSGVEAVDGMDADAVSVSAVPAQVVPANAGRGHGHGGGHGGRRRRPHHHNRDALSDIARILLLRRLFEQRRGCHGRGCMVFPFI